MGVNMQINTVNLIMITVSLLASMLHGMLILSSKKLQSTDGCFAYMLLAFAEGAFFANLLQSYYACELGLPKLFAMSTFMYSQNEDPQQIEAKASYILARASEYWDLFFWAEITILHGSVLMDVVRRFSSPFRVIKVGKGIRLLFTGILAKICCLSVIMTGWVEHGELKLNSMYFILVYSSMFFCFSIFVIVSCIFLMNTLGLGKETKKKIFLRQIILIVQFLVCNVFLIYAIGTHVYCVNRHGEENLQKCFERGVEKWYAKLFAVLFYSQGLILLMVRMLEPGMLRIHLGLLKKLFSCMFTGEPDDEEEIDIEPINMLFNSTLNIEFVYVILEGIVTFSKLSFG